MYTVFESEMGIYLLFFSIIIPNPPGRAACVPQCNQPDPGDYEDIRDKGGEKC